jgi:hypothetical protein
MKKSIVLLFALLLFIPLQASAEELERNYIVLLKDGVGTELLNQYELEIVEHFPSISAVTIHTDAQTVSKLKVLPSVIKIQEEQRYEINAQKTPAAFKEIHLTTSIQSQFTGAGINVGILDTGIDKSHPDLKVKGGVCVLKESCTNGYSDDNGHGTHVAGILGAKNNTIGIIGVASEADLYAIKAMDSTGNGTTTTILAGIEWALTNNIDILNMSVTTDQDDPFLKAILNSAEDQGLLIVAAAGNNGTKNGIENNILYPAKYSSVIAVGAVNDKNVRVSNSATGSELEVMAPGYNIFSTIPANIDLIDGVRDGYSYMTGTSMATPYVSGVLALYKEQYPYYSNQQLRELLTTSAKDLGTVGRDSLYGFGLAQINEVSNELPDGNEIIVETNKGSVQFTIQKSPEVAKLEVIRKGSGESTQITGDSWIDYVPAGQYSYTFFLTMNNGEKYSYRIKASVSEPTFTDISSSQWFGKYMVYLNIHEILQGYEDGSLRPYTNISRGEGIALVGRAIELDGTKRKSTFEDVYPSYFASGYIQSAYEEGIVKGFTDRTFRPSQDVTRAEMAILIAKAYGLQAESQNYFKDVSSNVTGSKEIAALKEAGITEGYTDRTFRPYQYITRSEFAVFLARAENSLLK